MRKFLRKREKFPRLPDTILLTSFLNDYTSLLDTTAMGLVRSPTEVFGRDRIIKMEDIALIQDFGSFKVDKATGVHNRREDCAS